MTNSEFFYIQKDLFNTADNVQRGAAFQNTVESVSQSNINETQYCNRCGRQIPEGSDFCSYCGQGIPKSNSYVQNISFQAQPYNNNSVDSRTNVRKSETDELHKMIRYFSQKSNQYDEFDDVCSRLNPVFLRKRVGLIVWGIILSVIGFGLTIAMSNLGLYEVLAIGVAILIGGAVMITAYILSTTARNNNYQQACIRYEELNEELSQHYRNYGYCFVSQDYTNPSTLMRILHAIQSGRADTIKEAVNIMIDDTHRDNMESYAHQTAVSSAAAARAAKASAVFGAANFFLKK